MEGLRPVLPFHTDYQMGAATEVGGLRESTTLGSSACFITSGAMKGFLLLKVGGEAVSTRVTMQWSAGGPQLVMGSTGKLMPLSWGP